VSGAFTRNFVIGGLREFWKSELHCDDENFEKSSKVLLEYKEDRIVAQADRASPKVLRSTLGRALHTLQDFYSHSNWVNRNPGPNHTTPNEKLGNEVIKALGPGVSTCQETWPDLLEGAGETEVTTGYFNFTGSLIWGPPTGKCAHGMPAQAGINKDEAGRPFFVEARNSPIPVCFVRSTKPKSVVASMSILTRVLKTKILRTMLRPLPRERGSTSSSSSRALFLR
jgi:hypothetical protein